MHSKNEFKYYQANSISPINKNQAHLDSGASRHYFILNTKLKQIRKTDDSIAVLLPNGHIINSSHVRLYPGLEGLQEKQESRVCSPT